MVSMPALIRHRRSALLAWARAFALVGAGCGASDSGSPPAPPPPPPPPPGVIATVTVDTLTRFQVMTGWEGTAQVGQNTPNYAQWKGGIFAKLVNDLGINRVRVPVRSGAENTAGGGAGYAMVNDNADPNVINPAGFQWATLDGFINAVVIPMRAALAARGERLYVNLIYQANVGSSPAASFVHTQPAEYAEFAVAVFQHIETTFGFVPDSYELILEPDAARVTPWTDGTKVGQSLVAAQARLAAAGYHPAFLAPSCQAPGGAAEYFDAMMAVPGAPAAMAQAGGGEIVYHRYGSVSDPLLAALASRAATHGFKTAMLEHIGSGIEDLYKDILVGQVSAWQQFTLAFPTTDDGAQYYLITNGQPVLASRTRYLGQYFRYIRLGAQRVGAASDNAEVRPLAFVNLDGRSAVVIHADRAGYVSVGGLRPGTYGTSVTTAGVTWWELGDQVAGTDGTITVGAPAAGVLTVYRK